MGVAQTYIDYLESEYVTQRNVLKKVQKELTERQWIILILLLSKNSITLDQMSKRFIVALKMMRKMKSLS